MSRAKVVVISMTSATDRREAFDGPGDAMPWSFFDARESPHPELVIDEKAIRKALGRPLSRPEIGCYSSHYAVWQELVNDDGFDLFVVVEDDVIVDWKSLTNILQSGDLTQDYVRLYYKRPVLFKEIQRPFGERSKSLLEIFGYPFGTQAYIITKAGARRFLDFCKVVKRPIDDTMDRSWEHGVRSFAIFPFPVIEKSIASSIESQRDRARSGLTYRWNSLAGFLASVRFQLHRSRFILRG